MLATILTAAAAIFLPITLIAGIYGTNFPASSIWPSYDSEWGFGAMIASMIVVTLAMLAYFKYRDWI